MAKQAVQKVNKNPLKQLEMTIAEAKNVKDLLQISVVSNRYIKNFEAATGRSDGAETFEREAFAFIELANNKPDIMKADKMSIFAGFVKAASTGLSFSSGKLSVYVRGGKLVVDPDAHGKKEMLERMPDIKKVDEGILVYAGDEFRFDSVAKRVTKHEQVWPRPKASEENIAGAYCTVHFTDGHREDVLVDIEEIKIARSKAPTQNVWNQHFGEMCKKTTYNRAKKVLYKQPNTVVLFGAWEGKETEDVTHQEVRPENVDEDGVVTDAEVVEQEDPEKETGSFID